MSPLLVETPDYQVDVRHGRRNTRFKEALRFAPGVRYVLAVFSSGEAYLRSPEGRKPVPVPGAVFLPPGATPTIEFPRNGVWSYVWFRVAPDRSAPLPGATDQQNLMLQPPPEEVWGVTPPMIVDETWTPSAVRVVTFVNDIWWRDAFSKARTNAHLQQWVTDYAAKTRAGDDDTPEWLLPVRDFVQARMDNTVTVSDVAQHLGISRQALDNRFRQRLGISPGKYLSEMRMRRASEMLLRRDCPVGTVGIACGFLSAAAFNRAFRRYHGCTPGQWKARARVV